MLQFALTALVTLLVAVAPVGVAPLSVSLTKDQTPAAKQAVLLRAVVIAFSVSIFFLVAGRAMLAHLGVTVTALRISGRI